ncbi:phage head closure protein [Streptomyces sp. NRRL F-5135]|uniref:phage head closure protein n=1 Tax=Streptomyces sp. NRRL F-5135 TaxID=1463858 RepID=UPI0004C553F7|nr:phage head closure protein [Streptomyces sp. NRRL F-5135]
MDITHLLNRQLTVWRTVTVPDGAGGQETSLRPVGDVAGKVDQPSAADRMLAAQAGSRHTHTVYLQPDADVRRGDQLHGDGQVLTVHSVVQPSAPVYRKAECELTQTEGT